MESKNSNSEFRLLLWGVVGCVALVLLLPLVVMAFMQPAELEQWAFWVSWCGVFSLLGTGIWWLAGFLRRHERQWIGVMQQMAAGELAQVRRLMTLFAEHRGNMPTAQALTAVVNELNSVLLNVRDAGEYFDTLGAKLIEASEQIAASLKEQSGQIDEVATSISQMTVAVDEVAQNTHTTAERASRLVQLAQDSERMTVEAEDSVEQLSTGITEASAHLRDLESQSENISAILDTIRGIADQTNLLALNAAIESARAGEHGRGFAVVADEVRKLAQNTQTSTVRINTMIDQLHVETREIGKAMQICVEQAETGRQKIRSMAHSLKQMTQDVEVIGGNNLSIATAAEEQAAVSASINQRTTNLVSMREHCDQVVADGLQVASVASTLGGEIKSLVSRFDLISRREADAKNDYFTWDRNFELEDAEINRQHYRLVELANEIYRLSQQKIGGKAAMRIINALAAYTVTHFAYEERSLARTSYPDLEKHKEEHRRLVERVLTFKQRIERGEDVGAEMLEFVKNWLTHHIQGSDRAYAAWMPKVVVAGINRNR